MIDDMPFDNFKVDNDSDTLVVTLGESWTYGDSLDPSKRKQQIYGSLIAKHFGADFINVAQCGLSNNWIIHQLKDMLTVGHQQFIDLAAYKKIYIILTLTEGGRDFGQPALFLSDYAEFAKRRRSLELYDELLEHTAICWAKEIEELTQSLPDHVTVIVGQNFCWHKEIEQYNFSRVVNLKKNWLMVIADDLGLEKPPAARLVTNWVFKSVRLVNNIVRSLNPMAFKLWSIDRLDEALAVNKWLDSSPVNCDKASKHPNPQGHEIWASYIIDTIENF